ncbi:cupin domain-containing protein [Pseudooceanicola nanhaiensis]|uniref:cupin domain-containing protein n=1 Tax=Pseudooceanicola nanhaiensis TaxID=375761 RepID=UPI001CD7274F|nr:cupin domain-containing protein [Pseudooceanicola nanhaiensis]MCA0922938.1 cupin domain-containing protein [Pseudooceanicola nanhaiensis]
MCLPSTGSATATLLAEDDKTKVTRWDFAPGTTTGWHEHEMDFVVIMMCDGHMAFTSGDEVIETEVKLGDTYQRPKGVQHDVRNPGPGPLSFIEVELKG